MLAGPATAGAMSPEPVTVNVPPAWLEPAAAAAGVRGAAPMLGRATAPGRGAGAG